jgi:hypothetical protein
MSDKSVVLLRADAKAQVTGFDAEKGGAGNDCRRLLRLAILYPGCPNHGRCD